MMAPSSSSLVATTLLRSSCNAGASSAPVAACVGVGGANAVMQSSQRRRYASSPSPLGGCGKIFPSPMHYNSQHRQQPTKNDVLLQQRRHFARSTKRIVSKRERFDKYSFEDGGRVSSPKEDKNILVIGSSGVLGKTLVSHFGNSRQWNVVGADVLDAERAVGEKGLRDYVRLPREGSVTLGLLPSRNL